MKQLQASEKRSMQEIAPSYFRYLAQASRRSAPTCLAKILGIYTVGLCELCHSLLEEHAAGHVQLLPLPHTGLMPLWAHLPGQAPGVLENTLQAEGKLAPVYDLAVAQAKH